MCRGHSRTHKLKKFSCSTIKGKFLYRSCLAAQKKIFIVLALQLNCCTNIDRILCQGKDKFDRISESDHAFHANRVFFLFFGVHS